MKKFLFISLTCIALNAMGQGSVTVVKDTVDNKKEGLILSNGVVIWEGSDIKCGRGTLPNGDFKYINTSGGSWLAVMRTDQSGNNDAVMPLNRTYSGLLLRVKEIKKMGNKKRGYKYILKVGSGNIVNFHCEIEDALYSNEIVF